GDVPDRKFRVSQRLSSPSRGDQLDPEIDQGTGQIDQPRLVTDAKQSAANLAECHERNSLPKSVALRPVGASSHDLTKPGRPEPPVRASALECRPADQPRPVRRGQPPRVDPSRRNSSRLAASILVPTPDGTSPGRDGVVPLAVVGD